MSTAKSLLHHSMILYGSGNADGNRHTHENLPIVLAGAGGGAFKPGRYVKTTAQPISNLFLSMADAMDAEACRQPRRLHRAPHRLDAFPARSSTPNSQVSPPSVVATWGATARTGAFASGMGGSATTTR